MTTAIDAFARDRAPLEKRRRQLLAELERVNRELASIGNVSVRNAARRWIEAHPGSTTQEVVEATGVAKEEISRMKHWEILENNRARGRGRIARWWVAGQAPRPDQPKEEP